MTAQVYVLVRESRYKNGPDSFQIVSLLISVSVRADSSVGRHCSNAYVRVKLNENIKSVYDR